MDFVKWGLNPWGQNILTHVSWTLFWASLFAGLMFLVAHGSYMLLSAHRKRPADRDRQAGSGLREPPRAHRAALADGEGCFTGSWPPRCSCCCSRPSCPSSVCRFAWVTWHWIAGLVLTGSILFHIIHASFWLDFWSIWVGPKDIPEIKAELLRELGHDVPGPKSGKYPLGNRLYHMAIVVAGLSAVLTRRVDDVACTDADLHA